MKPLRKLMLKKESLTELTTRELHGVAGGAATPNCPTQTCPSGWCGSDDVNCIVSQLIAPCLTDSCTHNCSGAGCG